MENIFIGNWFVLSSLVIKKNKKLYHLVALNSQYDGNQGRKAQIVAGGN